MPVSRAPNDTTGKLAAVGARAATRKSIADTAKALTAHYSKTLDSPPSGGGASPFSDPIAKLAPFSTKPSTVRAPRAGGAAQPGLPADYGNPAKIMNPRDVTALHAAVPHVVDQVRLSALQAGLAATAALHGHSPLDAQYIKLVNGKPVATNQKGASLLALQGTGDWWQKGGEDLYGIVPQMVNMALNPDQIAPTGKALLNWYEQNPIKNIEQDPVGSVIGYLPFAEGVARIPRTVGAVRDVARATAPGADLTAGEVARLREKGALAQFRQTGEVPAATTAAKAKLYARAVLHPPAYAPHTYTVHGPNGEEVTLAAPSANTAIGHLWQQHVTNNLISHALNGGTDILGGNGMVGRLVRRQLRVNGALRNASLARLAKLNLSPAEEHAVWMTLKGVDPEIYARYHQAGIDHASEAAANASVVSRPKLEEAVANHENGLHMTKIAAQHLKPGEENAKVMNAVDVIRGLMHQREDIYGMTEAQRMHALGSHYHGIVDRALGRPSMHDEQAAIVEAHGLPAASHREALDQEIAATHRRIAMSGPEHQAELQQHLETLHGMAHDIELKQHEIAQVDARIKELGDTQHIAGRFVDHPDRVAATSREALSLRSRLEDELHQLIAHDRHRQIDAEFTAKGGEVLGRVRPSQARDEFVHAVEAKLSPEEAAAEIKRMDGYALAWSRRTGESTAAWYHRFAQHTEQGGHAGEGALFELDPIHRYDAEREATGRRQHEKAGEPKYGNETVRDANGHVILGPITPHEWVARVLHAVPDKGLRDDLARWYESFEPVFREHFGEDANAVMRGFAVSQANQSPAGGVTAVLRVMDKLRRGETVTDREISTVAPAIAQAVKGDTLLEKGLGQKLSDFTDSLRGMRERTITGHSPEHGAPTAVDVHAARDLGYVDNKLVRRLQTRYGLEEGKHFTVDNPNGSPTGIAYERMVKQYQEITDHLNATNFDGRSDWTPAQVQALGWSAIQRFHGVAPEDLQFAIDRNTYDIPYEVGNGMEGSVELPKNYAGALKATKAQEPNIAKIIEGHGAYIRSFHYGPGGYEGDVNAAGLVRVIASPEQSLRVAQDIADHYKQWEVWSTRSGVTGKNSKAALEIFHDSFSSKSAVEGFWHAFRDALPEKLKDKAVGFSPIRDENGMHGMRVITGHQWFKAGDDAKLLDRYSESVSKAADHAGLDSVEVQANNVEVRKTYGKDHQAPDTSAENVGGGGAGAAGVRDHADAQAEGEAGGTLHQEVAGQVRGSYEPGSATIRLGENANAETVQHEGLHAVRQSLDGPALHALEDHYGVKDGQWDRAHEERFVQDMQAASRGEAVPQPVQTAYNSALVAPPEGAYLPFADRGKATKAVGGMFRRGGPFGHSPPVKEATHQFTGASLDSADFSTKATALAAWKFSKASHWEAMTNLFDAMWALSKATPEEAGRSRFGRAEAVPIRDIRAVTKEQRANLYAMHPGDFLEGEAPDALAKSIMDHLTRQADPGEHVRYVNADIVKPLTPQSAGGVARFFNGLNQVVRFGRYGPAYARWIPQNLVVNLTQQGPMIIRNGFQMATELGKVDPEVYYQIASAVDNAGSAHGLESDFGIASKTQHSVANFWARVADHVPRMLSFIHEANSLGFHTAADWEMLMNDPRLASERQAVIEKANKAAIDYGGLTPAEKARLKPIFASWPWLRAASLWGLRFPFEHPYQAGLGIGVGRIGAQFVQQQWAKHGGVAPPYMEGFYPGKVPWDTQAVAPWDQMAQDMQTVAGLSPEHPEDAGALFGSLAAPVKAISYLVEGKNQYGQALPGGPLKGALMSLAHAFTPFAIYQTATGQGSKTSGHGAVPAIEKAFGFPEQSGYDYTKAAANALKDLTNVGREEFQLKQAWEAASPSERQAYAPQIPVLIRLAQIKDSGGSKLDKARAAGVLQAAIQNEPLATLNGILTQNGLKPVSQGDLLAEKARLRSIHFQP